MAVCTSATIKAEGARDVMSQAAPTFCIQVPTLETMEANQSQRKRGWLRGVQALRLELSLNFLLLQPIRLS